ncbi:phosphodiester glycosidase family protein [Phytoactinopolyspora limicola]|uniref:phosphodiester glycosidase family protein n=1 Tax=Phytoactinopolyspora limicola TaxID=2715536 RepID=UPI0014087CD8|nr:phosphodiester glycosidase family protein [Phytoactinopolyspora limicola]
MFHRRSTRWRATSLVLAGGLVFAVLSPAHAHEETTVETFRETRPVGPGIELTTVDRYGPDGSTGAVGWRRSHELSVDLTGDVAVGRLFPGQVASTRPVLDMAQEAGAVAAVNADYFDIAGSGAPWGVGIQDGELVQSPLPNTRARTTQNAVMVSEDGVGAIGEIVFDGSVVLPGAATLPLDAMNKAELLEDQIGMFTDVWGTYCRCRPTEDTDDDVEVVVTDGVVAEVVDTPRAGAIAEDTFVLVGREAGAAALRTLEPGDEVGVDYQVRAPDDMRVRAAMSGRQVLVVDGDAQKLPPENNTREPRTAVGFSADGSHMWLVTVDGRQPGHSDGIGLDELAEVMVELGAHSALNLDGGGSTTLVARDPGQADAHLVNRPSDAAGQRPVPTGLALFVPEGSGTVDGFWVRTVLERERAAGETFEPPLRTNRVFPGLTRRLAADAHDEVYGPAELPAAARLHWRSANPRTGLMGRDGVFTARSPGETTITARWGRAAGAVDVTVLGELDRLETTPAWIGLTEPGRTTTFELTGYDDDDRAAPIEPGDVTVAYDEDALDVSVDDQGVFHVTALIDDGEEVVTVTAGEVSTEVPVGLGMREVVVDAFENTSNWDFWALRASGSISTTNAGYNGNGLRLDFDFTQTTLIRGAGIWPADNLLPVAGHPVAFTIWVNSEGRGKRTRLEVVDATGRLFTVEPGFLTEPGWQQVTYPVPAEVSYPVSLRRIFFNELDPAASYHGTVVLDELSAVVPREPSHP